MLVLEKAPKLTPPSPAPPNANQSLSGGGGKNSIGDSKPELPSKFSPSITVVAEAAELASASVSVIRNVAAAFIRISPLLFFLWLPEKHGSFAAYLGARKMGPVETGPMIFVPD